MKMQKTILVGLMCANLHNTVALATEPEVPMTPKAQFDSAEPGHKSFVRRHPYLSIAAVTMTALGAAGTLYASIHAKPASLTFVNPHLDPEDIQSFRVVGMPLSQDCDDIVCPYQGSLGEQHANFTVVEKGHDSRRLNIFGKDDRILPNQLDMTIFPHRTIGQLSVPGLTTAAEGGKIKPDTNNEPVMGICTASLIARDLILTNKHCFVADDDIQGMKALKVSQNIFTYTKFRLGLANGEALAETGIRRIRWVLEDFTDGHPDAEFGSQFSSKNQGRHADWAIAQLDDALGDEYGFMGVRFTKAGATFNKKDTNGDILTGDEFSGGKKALSRQGNLLGYSTDLNGQPGLHSNCLSHGIVFGTGTIAGTILHDCDATRGSSGAAFYDNDNIIEALNYGERRNGGDDSLKLPTFTRRNPNLMIATENFADDLKEILRTWPRRPAYPEGSAPSPTPAPPAPTPAPGGDTAPTPAPGGDTAPTPAPGGDAPTSAGSTQVVAWTITGGMIFVLLAQ